MASPTLAKSENKQSDALSQEAEPELAGEQSAQGARAGLPEFLRQIYGPTSIEDGMSEEEKEARGVALAAASQIQISLSDALQSLHDGRKTSSRHLAGSAITAKRTIHQRLQKEKDEYEGSWEAQDIATKSAILDEYDSLRDDYAARQSQIQQRVETSTIGVNTLFTEHQSNLDRAAQEGGADCEKARVQNRNKIMNDFYDTEKEVSSIAGAIRKSFGTTNRDDAMREGVSWVEGKVTSQMDSHLEDAQTLIDDFFLKVPNPDAQLAGLPEDMLPRVTLRSCIEASSKNVQNDLEGHQQEIIEQIQGTGPLALGSLQSIYDGSLSTLDQHQQAAPEQLAQLKSAAMGRMDLLAARACDQIDQALAPAQSALIHAETSVRRRIEPLGKKAIALLQADVPPREQEARDVASDLSRYFQSSADFASGSMTNRAAEVSVSFRHYASRTGTDLAAESRQAGQYVANLGIEIGGQIDQLHELRVGEMQSVGDELNEVLDDCDQKFIAHFASMIQSFRNQTQHTIDAMNAQVNEAMEKVKQANNKLGGTTQDAMYEAASDRAFKYDHRFLHALDVGLQSGWAFLKATYHFLDNVVEFLAKCFAIVILLVLFGVELAVAEALVELGAMLYMAYEALSAYATRVDKGQSQSEAILGGIGDFTGGTQIYHGFTDEYLTLPERTEMITGGVENLGMLVYGELGGKGKGDPARPNAAWLDEPPTPSSPRAAPAIEAPSAAAEGAAAAPGAWQPTPLKQTLAEWNLSQSGGRAGGEAVPPQAPTAPPAASPVEAARSTASGAAVPAAPTPVEAPVLEAPHPTGDTAPPPPPSIAPAPADPAGQAGAGKQPQETPPQAAPGPAEKPATPSRPEEDIPVGDPRLKEQGIDDLRPRIEERKAAKQAQQAAEQADVQVESVEVEQANEDTGQTVAVAEAVGGGRTVMASKNGGGGSGASKPPKPPSSVRLTPEAPRGRSSSPPIESAPPVEATKAVPDKADANSPEVNNDTGSEKGESENTAKSPAPVPETKSAGSVPEITAQPKGAATPENASGSTAVGKSRLSDVPKSKNYREPTLARHPETEIHAPVDVHHLVLKKGGSLLSDLMREMLDNEGIDPFTEPNNLVPKPSLRENTATPEQSKQLPEYGDNAHKEFHNLQSEKEALTELLGGGEEAEARAEEIVERYEEFRKARKEAIRSLEGELPPEEIRRLRSGAVTKAKLVELGLMDEGQSLLDVFEVRTDQQDLIGGLKRLKDEGFSFEPEDDDE